MNSGMETGVRWVSAIWCNLMGARAFERATAPEGDGFERLTHSE